MEFFEHLPIEVNSTMVPCDCLLRIFLVGEVLGSAYIFSGIFHGCFGIFSKP